MMRHMASLLYRIWLRLTWPSYCFKHGQEREVGTGGHGWCKACWAERRERRWARRAQIKARYGRICGPGGKGRA